MTDGVHGLALDEDDLAAARRGAHEALVLTVEEMSATGAQEPDAVLAHARVVHALGTETDPEPSLVLVTSGDADVLLEGARRVEEDLTVGLDRLADHANDLRLRTSVPAAPAGSARSWSSAPDARVAVDGMIPWRTRDEDEANDFGWAPMAVSPDAPRALAGDPAVRVVHGGRRVRGGGATSAG
jgi:hypothetical protein